MPSLLDDLRDVRHVLLLYIYGSNGDTYANTGLTAA